MTSHDRCADEETPLLQGKSKTRPPWSQISLVFIAMVAEPISSAYIFPFINQLIGELGITGGDDRKIGYYAGLIESLFFVTQALTTWQWSLLSDFVGRRPVILLGLLGLSTSYPKARLKGCPSRCIAGVLNGNVGVMKSMLGDLTDHTNMAKVFTLVPPIFCIGTTIAPLYGGALAKPQERWPHIFRDEFWATYPYFLPCFVSGCFTLLTFFVCAIFMKESLPSKNPESEMHTARYSSDNPHTNDIRPVRMLTLLKSYSVMIPIANYGTLALVEIGFLVLLPLFYSSPIEIGGLGFPPPIIGTFLAIFGIVDGIVQALVAAKLVELIGAKRVFCWAVLWFYPLILLFPIMSAFVTAQGGVGPIIWILLRSPAPIHGPHGPVLLCHLIFVTRAAPGKQSLGSVNGLSQSLTSIARAIGPALINSLFAASKEYNILGGNLVYVILALLTTILVVLSRRLPDLEDE
ncbi:MFS general substrate transporter [Boletus edulis]|nr:MFS general substrate transporter [Boletus edulis]